MTYSNVKYCPRYIRFQFHKCSVCLEKIDKVGKIENFDKGYFEVFNKDFKFGDLGVFKGCSCTTELQIINWKW